MMECMKSNNLNAALNLKGDSYFYTANQLEKVLPSCPMWAVVDRTIAVDLMCSSSKTNV